MIKTLRGKLTATYLIIMLLTIGFLGGAFYQMMQLRLTGSAEQGLLIQALEMAKGIAPTMAKENTVPLERLITSIGRWSPSHILVTDENGSIVFTTHELAPDLKDRINQAIIRPTISNRAPTNSVAEMASGSSVVVGVPIIYRGQLQGVLVLFKAFTDIYRTGVGALWLMLKAALISGILILIISILLARRMTRSIGEIGDVLEDIADGNLKRRVEDPGPDEIGGLARNVNLMSERLENLVEKLKSQEKNRRDLMANISHEFRTPITTIRGFAEALTDGLVNTEEEKLRYYRIIQKQAAHIENLTRDMLEFSKLESGQTEMKFQKFDLMELAKRLKESIDANACRHELKFSLSSYSPHLFVIGDQQRIGQVITNLVDNAIAFTPPGGSIKISLEDLGTQVRCSVTDSGVGIPAGQLDKVWNRFYRQDRPGNSDYQGTGLGLAIVRQIVETHGGKVGVVSEEARGSSFHFTLVKSNE